MSAQPALFEPPAADHHQRRNNFFMRGPLGHKPTHHDMLLIFQQGGAAGMLRMLAAGGACAGQKTIISKIFTLQESCTGQPLIKVSLRWNTRFGFGIFSAQNIASRDSKESPGPIVTRFTHTNILCKQEADLLRRRVNGGRCCIALGHDEYSVKPAAVTQMQDMAWLINTSNGSLINNTQNNCRLGACTVAAADGVRRSTVYLCRSVRSGQQLLLSYGEGYLASVAALTATEPLPVADEIPDSLCDDAADTGTGCDTGGKHTTHQGRGRPSGSFKHCNRFDRDTHGRFLAFQ